MNDTVLRSILNKSIACRHAGIGDFTEQEASAAMSEIVAIDVRADQAVKDAARNARERINREAGAKIVFALDEYANSLGFVQTDPAKRKRLPLQRHEIAHASPDWFLVDVSRAGARLRVSIQDEATGRSVLQRVHDGVDLQALATEHSGDASPL